MDELARRAKEVFLDALERPRDERAAHVEHACGGDAELAARVRQLLSAREEASQVELLSPERLAGALGGEPRASDQERLLREALVGRYELVGAAGAGGMAVVYRARDMKLDRTVAIKVLKPELAATIGGARFLREIHIAAGLQHPGILPLHDSGEAGGFLYAVMPFVEGETLQQLLDREGPLSLEHALTITSEVAGALDYAHASGFVHRDLKPGNVLLSDGRPVLADFGLATALEGAGDERLTETGLILGTPAYMSPEQASGDESVDHRSDLYSLGCVVYEMLAGRPPFSGGSVRAILAKHVTERPPPLAAARPELPPGVGAALGRMLSKAPEDRYQSASAFLTALKTAGAGVPAPRNGRWRALVLVLLAVMATVVAASLRGCERSGDGSLSSALGGTTVIAILPFTVRGGDDYVYLGEGMVDLLGTKLDGAGSLRSVDSHALLSFVEHEAPEAGREREAAARVAGRFDADLFLQGDVLEVGGNLHVTASLHSVDLGEPIGRASVQGPAEQVFDLVDDLVAQLLAKRFSGVAERLVRTAASTTDSLQALKTYLHGEDLFRSGQFSESLDAFEEAVESDPTFALAWYRLSVAAEWALRQDRTEVAAQRALALSDRLSEHDRRLLEARLANRRGDAVEAERLYRALLAFYPDDVEAWTQLAEVQFHYGPMRGQPLSVARPSYEQVISYQPDSVEAMWHLARIAAAEGATDEVQRLVDTILSLNPEGERALEMEALSAFAGTDQEEQERVLAALAGASEHVIALAYWNVGCYARNLEGMRSIAELNTRPHRASDARATARIVIAYIDVAQGRWTGAWQELDAAAALRPTWALEHRSLLAVVPFSPIDAVDELSLLRDALLALDAENEPPSALPTTPFSANDALHPFIRLHMLGLVEARLRLPAAYARASALEELEPPAGAPYLTLDLAAEIRARIAWEAGDHEAALRELEGTRRQVLYQICLASPFGAQAYGRFAHAQALAAAGRLQEASALFSSFQFISPHELGFAATGEAEAERIRAAQGKH